MAYKLRKRKQKNNSLNSNNSSDDDCDSSISDPDFSGGGSQSRRKLQKNVASFSPVGNSRVASSRRGRPRDNREIGEPSRRNNGPNTRQSSVELVPKRSILSWLIETQIIQENAIVRYLDRTCKHVWMEGTITRDGILCWCCDIVVTVWEFEVHAGSNLKRPYDNIYVYVDAMQKSLLSCQIEAWRKEEGALRCGFNHIKPRPRRCYSDNNDDACMLCADGGELICCEKCPSTFHANCMEMERVPNEDWLCPKCICKYCGAGEGDDNPLFPCYQCERNFHWKCFQERGELLDLNTPNTCGQICREIYKKLEQLVGERNELGQGFSWSLIQQKDSSTSYSDDLYKKTLCNSNIAVAWQVMDDCFRTIIDRHTQIDVIQSLVYNRGSNFPRVNFSGFYTAILEKGGEIISVASLRIHGSKLAEMPFIATRQKYRQKGMCRKLLVAIESALCYLKVKNLVIPSVTELVTLWIDKYGFSHMEEALRRDLIDFNILMFPKTIKLQKTLLTKTKNRNGVMKNNEYQGGRKPEKKASKLVRFDLNLEP